MAEGAPAIQRVTLRELTAHQKRELGSIMVAGLASAAFFLIPIAQAADPSPLASEPVPLQVATVAESPRSFALPAPARSVRPRVRQTFRAPQTGPMMTLASTSTIESSLLNERVTAAAEPQASSKGPGRLTKLLLGSGRYRVQPFPTPTSEQ
jgi:hypothetical protein